MTLHGSLDNYIAMHRERHGLSQAELSVLISVEQRGAMANIEIGSRRPSLVSLVALELVFGVPASELFRGVAEQVRDDVRSRARALLESIKDAPDAETLAKCELLSALAHPDDVRFIPLWRTE